MKRSKLNLRAAVSLLLLSTVAYSQAPIKEFVDDKGIAKIKKQISKEMSGYNCHPDGHGPHPYFTSLSQIPDTIALATFYVYDDGTSTTTDAGNVTFITTYALSEKGGNYFANQLLKESVQQLKEAFLKNNIVLLTAEEYLDTEAKRKFYYDEFKPQVSKLGSFLAGIETKRRDIGVCADYYRGFDEAAAFDFKRSVSLGHELAGKLDADAVLSIAVKLKDDGKKIALQAVNWTLNGPNPVPKQDKKYPGAFGAGYQEGLVYFTSHYFVDDVVFAKRKKKELLEQHYEGFGTLLSCFVEASVEKMQSSAGRNGDKK